MANEVTLKEDLPRWLRVLEVIPNASTQEKRRVGIEALLKQAMRADVETMIRLGLKTKQSPSTEAIARIRQPIKTADDSFHNYANDRELQILCAAALAELLRRHGDIPAVAALGLSTATILGVNKPDLPFDLAEAAEFAILAQAETRRRRPDFGKLLSAAFPQAEFDKVAAAFNPVDLNNVAPALTALVDAVRASHNALLQRCNDGLDAASAFINLQDEELEMLWWLLGERSTEMDRPMAKVSREERPFVLGKELADMTLHSPGPPAMKSLLGRGGAKESDRVTIPACVNACDVDWLKRLVDGADPSPVTRPLHLAIKRKLETGDDESWIAGWAAATEVNREQKFSALQVGMLFYRERLLAAARTGA